MKIPKLLTIDEDLAKCLSNEKNGSHIVNELLKDYYNRDTNRYDIENKLTAKKQEIAKKEEEISKLTNDIRLMEINLKTIKDKQTAIKKKFENIPREILEDFKAFPKMTKDILIGRWRDIYKGKISREQLLEAWKEWKDGKI